MVSNFKRINLELLLDRREECYKEFGNESSKMINDMIRYRANQDRISKGFREWWYKREKILSNIYNSNYKSDALLALMHDGYLKNDKNYTLGILEKGKR